MEKGNSIRGVHRVKKKLADGTVKRFHYAFRGGPKFWDSSLSFGEDSDAYVFAYNDTVRGLRPEPVHRRTATEAVVDRYLASAHFVKLQPRTQRDYRKYLSSFRAEFGEEPIKMFEDNEVLGEILEWKNQWAHSPKQFDYATTVVTRFLNWSMKEDASLEVHHHMNVDRLYKSNRSDIIWLPDEITALKAVATERERRVVIAASEGGLTPQDIGILTLGHVQKTPRGRRLFFKRTKTGNPVSIPVTPAMAELIDTTPKGQKYLVVSLEGRRLSATRASGIVRVLKERANAAASLDPDLCHIRDELRLYDMRGTAATELLRAGCSLNQIAVTMGWGLRHAANIIEKYAALVPEVTDEVLEKLIIARKTAETEQKGGK